MIRVAAIALVTFLGVPSACARDSAPWWNDCVFYEVFVRSFADSDGDGVGDLRGLTERLDYLNDGDPTTSTDLGVTGIWLMPIAESPSYHGYDVTDFDHVDREYGTDDDFRTLMREAHARGIRVIVDLVLNHTSSEHPWFRASRSDPRSDYRDWYVWRDDHPGWKGPWGAPAWHADGGHYYYGVFWSGMPDLNYRNPAVTSAMREVARLWLSVFGADGFRLDAIKHLIEDGKHQENTATTMAWFAENHAWTKSVKPAAFVVGEVWSPSDQVLPWIGTGVDVAFEFTTAGAMLKSAREEDASAVRTALRYVASRFPPGQWATFLTNHDQDRVIRQLRGNRSQARTAASLLLTAPGVPFLYYGEEIGQTGAKPDEDIRTPMQWTGGRNAGFTDGHSAWRAPQPDHREVNVATQTGDPSSLLSHYRRLVHLRNRHAALRRGTWIEVRCDDPGVYACLRDDSEERLLVIVNLTDDTLDHYRLSLSHGPFRSGIPAAHDLYGGEAFAAPDIDVSGGFSSYTPLVLAPHATVVVAFDEPTED